MIRCHLSSGVAEASEGVERKVRVADLFRAGRDESGQQGHVDLPTKQVWRACVEVERGVSSLS